MSRAGDGRELVPFGVARRAGEARADEDVRQAILVARAQLPHLPEYVTLVSDSNGRHINLPERARAEGMLGWIEQHYVKHHPTPFDLTTSMTTPERKSDGS
jgi:hypothetical protein